MGLIDEDCAEKVHFLELLSLKKSMETFLIARVNFIGDGFGGYFYVQKLRQVERRVCLGKPFVQHFFNMGTNG